MIDRLFLEHPRSIGMSWAEHGKGAVAIGMKMMLGGLICVIHAIFPGLFKDKASRMICEMYAEIQHRVATQCPEGEK